MRLLILSVFVVVLLCLVAEAAKPDKDGKKPGNKPDNDKKPDDKGKKPDAKKMKERKEKLKKRKDETKKKFKARKSMTQVDNDVGNSTVRVDKKGAKIEINREGQVFELRLKHIYEKIANKTERNEYNLKKANFDVNVTKNDASTYGVNAGVVRMEGKLNNNATVKFFIYMLAESANITGEDGNEYELVEGGVKMNMEIDWPYETEHLEVKIAMKCGLDGKKGKKPVKGKEGRGIKGKGNARGPKTYDVCPNARMTFSPSFKSNGTKKDMPENYPMPAAQLSDDNESEVTLKFNGAWKNVFYDPTAETGDDIGDDPLDSSSAGVLSATPSSITTILIPLLFSVFKFVL